VIMTHSYDGFKCSSLRDNVDTKSWLANEQKPYLTHKIRYESLNQHDLKSVGSQVMNLRIVVGGPLKSFLWKHDL
jgi:hypothetical protein